MKAIFFIRIFFLTCWQISRSTIRIIYPLILLAILCASCGLKALPEIPSAEPALDNYLHQLQSPADPKATIPPKLPSSTPRTS